MNRRLLILPLLLTLWSSAAVARDLVIFAAASLKEPLDALAADFGEAVVSTGGSGGLARQIQFGAPADVVVLAHPQWMQALLDGGYLLQDSYRTIASNRLVLVGHDSTPVALTTEGIDAALGPDRLAIGLTEAVPAGIYGRAAMEALGLWDGLSDRLAETDSVRAALAMATRKEVPLALVYATDARIATSLSIRSIFPTETHPTIRYDAAAVAAQKHQRTAEFLDLLSGPEGQAALSAAGFLPAPDTQ